MDNVVENKSWRKNEKNNTAITSIEYDAETRKLVSDAQKADALSGTRGDAFLKQAAARGLQSAGENGGGEGLAMFGFGAGQVAGFVPPTPQTESVPAATPAPATQATPAEDDTVAQLTKFKGLLDAGLITQEDYDAAKKKALGL